MNRRMGSDEMLASLETDERFAGERYAVIDTASD